VALCAAACAETGALAPADGDTGDGASSPSKADQGRASDLEWAQGFFLTQIYDAHWNPDGIEADEGSNSCGPASFAMELAERAVAPAHLSPEMAIDHARAMMVPGYPEIDASSLPDGAVLYEDQGLVFVDDDTRPVYFDAVEDAPSIPHGITQQGGEPVFSYTWSDLDGLLELAGGVMAHGHITDAWRARFPGEYGPGEPGAIPHFIAVFPATAQGELVVCDPMHKGGPVIMDRTALLTFFKSPVNVYETSVRMLAWGDPPEPSKDAGSGPAGGPSPDSP